jgi:hypothetical protein
MGTVMSKNINVNPDHYKVAGRERPGEDVVHEVERRELARGHGRARRQSPRIPNQERASQPARGKRPKSTTP